MSQKVVLQSSRKEIAVRYRKRSNRQPTALLIKLEAHPEHPHVFYSLHDALIIPDYLSRLVNSEEDADLNAIESTFEAMEA